MTAGFAQLLHAEWTKFRTVRGWVTALLLGALLIVAVGALSAAGSHRGCDAGTGRVCAAQNAPLTGPDGAAVTDNFYFVHQTLDGDGSVTVRVTSLAEQAPLRPDGPGANGGPNSWTNVTVPWAKAGLIVKASGSQGSPYAAVMATASHGVRFQYDFTHDVAGHPGAVSQGSPQWLRLTRAGNTVTAYESVDGAQWSKIGATTLTGLPSSVEAGMFVASPDYQRVDNSIVGTSTYGGPSRAMATFDSVAIAGKWSPGTWSGGELNPNGYGPLGTPPTPFQQSGGTFSVTGSGDMAPGAGDPDNNTIGGSLIGTFVGLLAIVVLGALFMTAEYRRGLIRTSLAAVPARGRLLAAKAVVLAGVTFVVSAISCAVAAWWIGNLRRDGGVYIMPSSVATEARVVLGTAAMLALAAVFALAIGTIIRRSAAAIATVVALVVLPYILGASAIGPLQWLLRLTPASAFSVQGVLRQYSQVDAVYVASSGYFPLAPWAGFGVLCLWTAGALGLAWRLLRKRDA
jgi:ABC-2 family transporter